MAFLERQPGYKSNPFEIKANPGIINASAAAPSASANLVTGSTSVTVKGSTSTTVGKSSSGGSSTIINHLMTGSYTFPNGDVYKGSFYDQQFHGQGTIYFRNNGGRMDCEWDHGKLITGKFAFPDGLVFGPNSRDWDYCIERAPVSTADQGDKPSVPEDEDEDTLDEPTRPSPMTIIERKPTRPVLQRKWTSASTPRLPGEQAATPKKVPLSIIDQASKAVGHAAAVAISAQNLDEKSSGNPGSPKGRLIIPGNELGERRASLAISMVGSNISTGTGSGQGTPKDNLSSGSINGDPRSYAESQYISSQPEEKSDDESMKMSASAAGQQGLLALGALPPPTASTLGLNALANAGSAIIASNISMNGSSVSIANRDLSDPDVSFPGGNSNNDTTNNNTTSMDDVLASGSMTASLGNVDGILSKSTSNTQIMKKKRSLVQGHDPKMIMAPSTVEEETTSHDKDKESKPDNVALVTDRRFYTERVSGLEGAGHSRIANIMPAPTLTSTLFYDVGDGYFDSSTGKVMAWNGIEVVRIPDTEEIAWITSKCRHG